MRVNSLNQRGPRSSTTPRRTETQDGATATNTGLLDRLELNREELAKAGRKKKIWGGVALLGTGVTLAALLARNRMPYEAMMAIVTPGLATIAAGVLLRHENELDMEGIGREIAETEEDLQEMQGLAGTTTTMPPGPQIELDEDYLVIDGHSLKMN